MIKWITNCSSLSKTIQVEKLCNFQILYRKNLIAFFVVIVIYIRIKWVFLDTKSITVITISNIMNFRSLTMKFIFIVFYLILDIDSRHSLPRSKCHDSCHMQVHPSGNYISIVISSPNYTSPPFLQHALWQYCNYLDISSSTVEILLFNSVFHDGVTPVSISTLKPLLGVIGALPLEL